MRISVNWLKDYIDFKGSTEQLTELLTNTGLEVEGLERVEKVEGGLAGLVIGEVLTCTQHPNADRLTVTSVEVGESEPVQIVCGAPNVASGQKVVVALPGTTLYPIEGDSFKIKKGKIRGEASHGMICAEDEIGLGKSHDGIMVLDTNAEVGMAASAFFNLEAEEVIEIGLTPNRADAASHIGVARDLVALSKIMPELGKLAINWPLLDQFEPGIGNAGFSIHVDQAELSPRYCGLVLNNVTVQPSPEWLQTKLTSIGLSPINNVVDITNFVLHEMGQPLHAFDADKITSKEVHVKTLKQGTPFVTLDGAERKLDERDLMICNGDEPMCIAGVFGGEHSGVSDETTSVFLESAYFNPVSVRKTAKRHGLNTDASFRFERGIDPEITQIALKRAALLLQELAGAEIVSEIMESYPTPISGFQVDVNLDRLNQLAGVEIEPSTVKAILNGLDIKIVEESGNQWKLSVPAFRVDVQREADVIEEVLRIYGFDHIPLPEKMHMALSSRPVVDKQVLVNRAADWLTAQGFYEGMSNSQTKNTLHEKYDAFNPEHSVSILNPLSQEYTVMRQSMVFNSLEAVQYNQNRQHTDIKLFEFGKVYHEYNEQINESERLAITLTGSLSQESWRVGQEKVDFYYVKGIVFALLNQLGVPTGNIRLNEDVSTTYHSGLILQIGKMEVATIGQLNHQMQTDFDIRSTVFFADLNWETIVQFAGKQKAKHQPVAKFPKVRRDLALLVPSRVKFAEIAAIASKTEKKLLKDVNLFDVYEGKNLEAGTKSYAVSFEFQDETKTLNDKQIEKIMSKLIQSLETQLDAKLRS